MRWIICASPDYINRMGMPMLPAEVRQHQCISLEGLPSPRTWIFQDGDRTLAIPIQPRLTISTAEAAVDAAIAGIGLARVVSYQAVSAIADGRLVPVLRDYWQPAMPVHVVHGPRRYQPLKLRSFLDFTIPRLSQTITAIGRVTS